MGSTVKMFGTQQIGSGVLGWGRGWLVCYESMSGSDGV
jgi:hypothetical protein